jgi:hypothetical protein
LRDHNRITTPDRQIAGYADSQQLASGILIGYGARLSSRRRGLRLRPTDKALLGGRHPHRLLRQFVVKFEI